MSDAQSSAVEAADLKRELLAWYPHTDDRLRPLLFAEAGRRGAVMWDTQDAENVIAFLLSRSTPAPSDQAGWQDALTGCVGIESSGGNGGHPWVRVSFTEPGQEAALHSLLAELLPTAPTLTAGEGGGKAEPNCECGKPATTRYDGDDMCEPCATYCARRDFEEQDMPGGF